MGRIETNKTEKEEEQRKRRRKTNPPQRGKTGIRELTSQSGLSCPSLSKVATSKLKEVINNQNLVT